MIVYYILPVPTCKLPMCAFIAMNLKMERLTGMTLTIHCTDKVNAAAIAN